MAFQPNNLVRWSPVYPPSPDVLPVPISPVPGLPQQWAYQGGADTMSDVQASGYFVYFADWVNNANYNQGNFFQVGDTIYCVCSDGITNLSITQLNPNITTSEILAGVNSVDTAAIQNQAVTADKIEDGTITSEQISFSAEITGTQLDTHTITSIELAMDTIQFLSVPMTAIDWNGMYASPFLLINSGGTHTVILVKQMMVEVVYGGTPFSGGGTIAAQYDSVVHGAGTGATDIIGATAVNSWSVNSSIMVPGLLTNSVSASIVNKNIYLSNMSGPYTTGNSNFNINIWYSIIPTTA